MIYDHLPTPVQQWLDNREQDRMAGEQYEQWLRFNEETKERFDNTEVPVEPIQDEATGSYRYPGEDRDVLGDHEEDADLAQRTKYVGLEYEETEQFLRETGDADLERLEHEQSTAAGTWSGDRGAELERLERSEQTHGERSLDEPPERGIEDDEEELER
jgi:hypothetical protein